MFQKALLLTMIQLPALGFSSTLENRFECSYKKDLVDVIISKSENMDAYIISIRGGKETVVPEYSSDYLPNGDLYKILSGDAYYSVLPVELMVELETDSTGQAIHNLKFEIRNSGIDFSCTKSNATGTNAEA